MLLESKDVLQFTWFTDESFFFCSDGIAHNKNQHLWVLSKDAVEPVESQLTPIRVQFLPIA